MPAAVSQVEVQAPPGLEEVGRIQQQALNASGSSSSSPDPRQQTEQDLKPAGLEGQRQELKEDIVREVTEAVREHIEWKTAAAVDTLWQRGQKAMQYLQQQQVNQTTQLQSQLNECAEAHKKLERENAMLRSGLEALMKHLTLLFGPPPSLAQQQPMPHMPPASASSPFFQQPSTPSQVREQSLARVDEEAVPPTDESHESNFRAPLGGTSGIEGAAVEELMAAVAQQQSHLSGLSAAAIQTPQTTSERDAGAPVANAHAASAHVAGALASGSLQAPTFTLTLRRADNVPLGLDVRGDEAGICLIVESVRPGGAVEAWNRQCSGDSREIRAGDSIITINGAEDAKSMREECLTVHLLKMTVVRGGGLKELTMSRSTSGSRCLRADADEFVPKASPWPAPPSVPPPAAPGC